MKPTRGTAAAPTFQALGSRQVVAQFSGHRVTSDAGALLLREVEAAVGAVRRLAACFVDHRSPEAIEHSVSELAAVDSHGEDRYHRIVCRPQAVDVFLDSHATAPETLVVDLDATDDPLPGQQEGRFFHGYYGGYCYLPLSMFCGHRLLVAKLRPANIDAAAGAVDEVERVVGQLCARWGEVRIILRADSGFARELYEDFYCARGDMENRIEERQMGLFADRTSTSLFFSDQPRLWFSSFAYVLLDALCRLALARAHAWRIRVTLLKIGAVVSLSVHRILSQLPLNRPVKDVFLAACADLRPAGPLAA